MQPTRTAAARLTRHDVKISLLLSPTKPGPTAITQHNATPNHIPDAGLAGDSGVPKVSPCHIHIGDARHAAKRAIIGPAAEEALRLIDIQVCIDIIADATTRRARRTIERHESIDVGSVGILQAAQGTTAADAMAYDIRPLAILRPLLQPPGPRGRSDCSAASAIMPLRHQTGPGEEIHTMDGAIRSQRDRQKRPRDPLPPGRLRHPRENRWSVRATNCRF